MRVGAVVLSATRFKRGKRADEYCRTLEHNAPSWPRCLFPWTLCDLKIDQVCFIVNNRSETGSVDCSAGCSLTLCSIASLRLRLGERFDSDYFGLFRYTNGFQLSAFVFVFVAWYRVFLDSRPIQSPCMLPSSPRCSTTVSRFLTQEHSWLLWNLKQDRSAPPHGLL